MSTRIVVGFALLVWLVPFAYAAVDAGQIVERADRIRFPKEAFQVDVTITNENAGDQVDVRKYRVLSKGNERTLVMTLAPPVDRGQILLMRDEDLWVFMPSVSQPIRLPLSQKLTGEVANGDLARANFTGDYHAKTIRVDTIDDAKYYVLELNAARRGVTYERIMYWVGQRDYRPYKAQFFTVSGRLLKTAFYTDYDQLGGMVRPTKMVVEDALRQGRRSVMKYSNMRYRALPDKVFTKYYLKKLR
jgi:outer membrane lipoprotein-sorting protein